MPVPLAHHRNGAPRDTILWGDTNMKTLKLTMKCVPLVLAAALAGCGGGASTGGGTGTPPPTTYVPQKVTAGDFPVANARVTFANTSCAQTITSNDGEFTVPKADCGAITVTGGTDTISGKSFQGRISAPDGAKVVSTITTMIDQLIKEGKAPAEAKKIVTDALALAKDPLTTRPIDDAAALAFTQSIAQVGMQLAETFTRSQFATTPDFQNAYQVVAKHVAKKIEINGGFEIAPHFVSYVAEHSAVELGADPALAKKVAEALGPVVTELAALLKEQIDAVAADLDLLNGDTAKIEALLKDQTNIDAISAALTELGTKLTAELAKVDFVNGQPQHVIAQVQAIIEELIKSIPTLVKV